MVLHGDDDALHRQVESLGHRLDDADVGLVRHQPVDRGLLQAVGRERLVDGAAELGDRHLEHFAAGHLDADVHAARDRRRT